MVRPPSKGRQRIEIHPILDEARRQVICAKRKKGLFKKASEVALLCGAHVAVVVFSSAGNVSAMGSPSADHVLRRLAPLPGEEALEDVADREAVEATLRQAKETWALVAAEEARMRAVGDKVTQAVPGGRRFWWEADVDALGPAELPEFARALQRLMDNVRRHAENVRSAPVAPPMLQE